MFLFGRKRQFKKAMKETNFTVTLQWMSWPVFRKTVPNANYDLWAQLMHPDNIYDFLDQGMSHLVNTYRLKAEEMENLNLQICGLGEEYLTFLKEHELEQTVESQLMFSKECPQPAHTLTALAEGDAKTSCYLYVIPTVVTRLFPEKITDYKIDSPTRQKIRESLEEYYGKGNVYVPMYVLDSDKIETDAARLKGIGQSYFETNTDTFLMKFNTQEGLGLREEVFLIPYIVHRPLTKTTLSVKELCETGVNLWSKGLIGRCPEIGEAIKKVFYDAKRVVLAESPTMVR